MLIFNDPPDYENPGDYSNDVNENGDFEDEGDNPPNMYEITVRATEKSGTTNRALSTEEHFTVEVTNEDEGGTITFDRSHPEIGTMITAELRDGDRLHNVGTGGTAEAHNGWRRRLAVVHLQGNRTPG